MMWHWVTLKISQILFTVRVIRHGPKVALGETFKTMWHWVTLTEGQGRSLYLKVRKCLFWPFLAISQTLFIGSEFMKAGFQVAYGETFKKVWLLVTLTEAQQEWWPGSEGQGHSLFLNIGKYPFNNFWQYLWHYL